MSEWIEVGTLEQIPKLGARVIKREGGDIALFRNSNDELFALRDHCPHQGGPLSQGIVHGRRVTCPLHNWVIGLDDGEAVGPDQGCVKTYPVRIESGVIKLKVSD